MAATIATTAHATRVVTCFDAPEDPTAEPRVCMVVPDAPAVRQIGNFCERYSGCRPFVAHFTRRRGNRFYIDRIVDSPGGC